MNSSQNNSKKEMNNTASQQMNQTGNLSLGNNNNSSSTLKGKLQILEEQIQKIAVFDGLCFPAKEHCGSGAFSVITERNCCL